MDNRERGISLDRFSDFQLFTAAAVAAIILGITYVFLWSLIPAIGVVWVAVRLVNQRDDPRHAKRPPDDP